MTHPEPTKPQKSGVRDPYISNVKVALIILVVIGHAWNGVRYDSQPIHGAYMLLYVFHMPAFVMLSGYLSKSFTGKPRQMSRLLSGILAPYLIFSVLYAGLRAYTHEDNGSLFLDPYYLLWFLAALFVWRLTAPFWKLVRFPLVIAIAISVGALAFKMPGTWDMGRVIQFLPFFVAGMLLKREHFDLLRRTWVRVALVGGVALVAIPTAFYGPSLHDDWFYYNKGAEQVDMTFAEAVPVRLFFLAGGFILTAAFLAFVPGREFGLSKLGDATMYPYLLHGFVVKLAEYWGWYDHPVAQTLLGAAAVTWGAFLLCLALMTKPVRFLARPFVEPKLRWLLRPEPREPIPKQGPEQGRDLRARTQAEPPGPGRPA